MTYKQNLKAILDTHLPVIKDEIKDSIIDSILRLKTQEEWIPVSERLPEESGPYLVSVNCLGYPHQRAVDGFFCGEWVLLGDHVKAWMPLPEPYKEETKIE